MIRTYTGGVAMGMEGRGRPEGHEEESCETGFQPDDSRRQNGDNHSKSDRNRKVLRIRESGKTNISF